ncbi:MAG: methionine synthase [Firmicutes bacterium]|nr:methionine synthase [Bacillota bacterium]
MASVLPELLDIDEVLRYMGCPPQQADAATRTLAEECAGLMLREIRPRWTYRREELTPESGGVRLGSGLLLAGDDLKRHLQGCHQALLFAVTLSAGADLAIRRAESRDLARALCLDCCATAAVEQVCGLIEDRLREVCPGCCFTTRFSPGYGDLPLNLQGPLLELLDAPRRIGLCVNDHHILTPRKSVTAIIGLSREQPAGMQRDCGDCPLMYGCHYRKAGGHCGLS